MTTSPISSNPLLSSLMSTGSTTSGSSAASNGTANLADASNFYNLLVTQLTNQDPLNPMDASSMSAQLAQFSTASGVQSVEKSLTALATQINQSEGLQAANLVGKNVTYDSNSLSLGASGAAAGFTLSAPAGKVNVAITDSTGQVVDTVQLGSMSAGVQAFTWDGTDGSGRTLPQGSYTFNVQASDASGNAVTATPFGVGTVSAVLLGGSSGPSVQLQGQNASVPLANLQGVI